MSLASKMQQLDAWNAKVHMMRMTDSYVADERRWNVDFEKNDGEAAIKVSLWGPTLEAAFDRAFERFEELSHEGLSLVALAPPVPEPIDDEIPF